MPFDDRPAKLAPATAAPVTASVTQIHLCPPVRTPRGDSWLTLGWGVPVEFAAGTARLEDLAFPGEPELKYCAAVVPARAGPFTAVMRISNGPGD